MYPLARLHGNVRNSRTSGAKPPSLARRRVSLCETCRLSPPPSVRPASRSPSVESPAFSARGTPPSPARRPYARHHRTGEQSPFSIRGASSPPPRTPGISAQPRHWSPEMSLTIHDNGSMCIWWLQEPPCWRCLSSIRLSVSSIRCSRLRFTYSGS